MEKLNQTGDSRLPAAAATASNSSAFISTVKGKLLVEADQSIRERVETWYINPLKKLGPDDAFASLMLCLPLIEKIVRYLNPKCNPKAAFTEDSELSGTLTRLLDAGRENEEQVLVFWDMFRNGLLHGGSPKSVIGWSWQFETGREKPLRWQGTHLFVDPWCLQSFVIKLLEDHRKAWKDDLFPLAKVYREI